MVEATATSNCFPYPSETSFTHCFNMLSIGIR
jgi:hypothetical protein